MFECSKTALAAALTAVTPVVKDKHTIPILQNVLLTRDGEALQVSGNNLESEISTHLPADFLPDFEPFTCPIGQFREFVRIAPAERVRVEGIVHGGKLTAVNVASGRSKLKINTLPAADYPKLDTGRLGHGFTIDGGILKGPLSAVAYAICADKDTVMLHGVLFEASADGMHLVASDRKRIEHRLIPIKSFDDDNALDGLPRITLPKAGVDRILGMVEDDRDITIEMSPNKLRAIVGNVVMVTKLLEASFPPFRELVPQANDIRAAFSGKAANDAVSRVLLATPDASKGVVFRFTESGLALSARDFANGEGEDEIDAEVSEPVTMGFNGKLLQGILAHMAKDDVEVLLAGKGKPAIIRSPGDEANYTVFYSMNIPGMV